VPAAAVIPAPIRNIKVVAVKKLVVGFLRVFSYARSWRFRKESRRRAPSSFGGSVLAARSRRDKPIIYCEQIGVFKAGFVL
jgi:hypothetical protein